MKLRSLSLGFSFAAALLGALMLAVQAVAKTTVSTAESVTVRVDVDRTVLPADTTDKAVIKIALDGLRQPGREQRPPVNLALVIDRSGSMSGEKIASARRAALEAIRRLAPDDVASLVAYDTKIDVLVPAQRVGNGRRFEEAIREIEAGGGTALHGGVVLGAAEVRKNFEDRRFINRVILLSDGQANQGPSSPEALGRLGADLGREGIAVSTIGLGLGFNEDLMARLAQRSEGNTYFVEQSSDLARIFAAELGDVLSVVARSVVIEIEFPAGVRPIRFVGREGSIRGQKAEVTVGQIYGGQEKFALVEVEVDSTKAGREIEIAKAQVKYEDAVQQRTNTLTAKRTVQFSSDREVVVKSADHRVQTDWAVNVTAEAKARAIELVDAGRRAEAAQQMRDSTVQLQAFAVASGNSKVVGIASANHAEAEKLEREGLDNVARKIYRAESTQTVNQQSNSGSFSSSSGSKR